MPIIITEAGRDFAPAPEGVHLAVCCDVVEMNGVRTAFGVKDLLSIRWQIDELNPEFEEPGYGPQPYLVTRRYTRSLDVKSNLRRDLVSWRGRQFTREEMKAGFDVERLIGANCQLQIQHVTKPDVDKTYANVINVMPPPKGAARITVSDAYVRVKDRDQRDPDERHADEDDDPIPF
jgi:hypothetical protein